MKDEGHKEDNVEVMRVEEEVKSLLSLWGGSRPAHDHQTEDHDPSCNAGEGQMQFTLRGLNQIKSGTRLLKI